MNVPKWLDEYLEGSAIDRFDDAEWDRKFRMPCYPCRGGHHDVCAGLVDIWRYRPFDLKVSLSSSSDILPPSPETYVTTFVCGCICKKALQLQLIKEEHR